MTLWNEKYSKRFFFKFFCLWSPINTSLGKELSSSHLATTQSMCFSLSVHRHSCLAWLMISDCLLYSNILSTVGSYSQRLVNKSFWKEVKGSSWTKALPASYIIHSIQLYPWDVSLYCPKRLKWDITENAPRNNWVLQQENINVKSVSAERERQLELILCQPTF